MKRHLIGIITATVAMGSMTAQPPHPGPPPSHHAICVLEPQAFDRLIAMVSNQAFDDNKFLIIEAASLGGYFTCTQVSTILSEFNWDNEKLRVLQYVAPRIVDLRNADVIFNQFTFDSDKKKAWDILTGKE